MEYAFLLQYSQNISCSMSLISNASECLLDTFWSCFFFRERVLFDNGCEGKFIKILVLVHGEPFNV